MTRTATILVISGLFAAATSVSALSGPAYAGPGDPWAIGYGMQAERSCPDWRMERQQVLAARRVLPKMGFGSRLLAMDGPFSRELYRGQADAEADRRRHADFCRRLRQIAGPRWTRLARVVRPASS